MIGRARLFLIALLAACAVDGGGGGGTGPTNEPPVVTAGPNGSVLVGTPYSLSAAFTDDADGPWTYTIQWGDGTSENGTRGAQDPITATHVYASESSYRIQVDVTDKLGATGSDALTVTATAPVLLMAGDIADCGPTRHGDAQTADLLDDLEGIVVALGDNAYLNGTPEEYRDCYAPTWGRHKARTRPMPGNHDYYTDGAAGYYGYFGAAAGDPNKGYYSYTFGSWFVIVLNSGTEHREDMAAGSPQEQWLRSELATHSQQCVLAMWHHPRFTSVLNRNPKRPEVKPLWDALYEYGADLVVNGHDHTYQRFAPQTPDGELNNASGIRQITVGTGGGEGLYDFGPTVPNLEVRNNETFGVLKLTLRTGGYDWRFVPVAGQTFTDSGSGNCHGRPS